MPEKRIEKHIVIRTAEHGLITADFSTLKDAVIFLKMLLNTVNPLFTILSAYYECKVNGVVDYDRSYAIYDINEKDVNGWLIDPNFYRC